MKKLVNEEQGSKNEGKRAQKKNSSKESQLQNVIFRIEVQNKVNS